LKLDDNFKIEGEPIIEFVEEKHWYGGGYFNIFQSEEVKQKAFMRSKFTYLKLDYYQKFNAAQLELYKKFLDESYAVKICPYWILTNEQDKEAVIKKIGSFSELNYKYPFIVGKEGGFIFQEKKSEMKDFYDHEQRKIYRYELNQLTDGK
jgi:hypothetical protein